MEFPLRQRQASVDESKGELRREAVSDNKGAQVFMASAL